MGYKTLRDAFWPEKSYSEVSKNDFTNKTVAAVIPTYNPNDYTYRLVESLTKLMPQMKIVVVDDCSPLNGASANVFNQIQLLVNQNPNVFYIRTPKNYLKAGAINYGLRFMKKTVKGIDVVFAFDDDVVINKNTIPYMLKELYSNQEIGAVCSLASVKNKNVNILTRLQALEYHSFNIAKIADNSLFYGPLVMQGMLTAFRWQALDQVKGFTKNHLIEDYDVTVRLKLNGWKVRIAQEATASTYVPEKFSDLWRQRVRWGLGGLQVISQHGTNVKSVFQDILGHALFLSLFALILTSFAYRSETGISSDAILVLLVIAVINFLASFGFSLYQLFLFKKADRKDKLIRLAIVPELVYSQLLSIILIGSYVFFAYTALNKWLGSKFKPANVAYSLGQSAFEKVGYSSTWGTRLG